MSAQADCKGPITHGTARELARGLRHHRGRCFISALKSYHLSRSFRLHDGPFKPNSVLLFKPKLRALSFAETLPRPPSMKSADVKFVQPDDIRLDRPEHAAG